MSAVPDRFPSSFPDALPRPEARAARPLPAGMRDLLPAEARRHADVAARVLDSFERFGYERVVLPVFEYADVLAAGIGSLGADEFLRLVEPETGEVLVLRPDMTPQVARLVATRLQTAPPPARLCYQGSVVRRRRERARRHREILQAGIELVGLGEPEGDLEVLAVAAAAARGAGLDRFVLDLGHVDIARSLLSGVAPGLQSGIIDALTVKNAALVHERASRAGIDARRVHALGALPELHGGEEVWARAEAALGGTPAAGPLRELRSLADAVGRAGFASALLVDLGETWRFAYYTGFVFQLLADGPGEALGAGGRYDALLERYGAPRPAAGFALDVGHVVWALDGARAVQGIWRRILVAPKNASSRSAAQELLGALRDRKIACAEAPHAAPRDHAQAWRYSDLVEIATDGAEWTPLLGGRAPQKLSGTPTEIAARLATVEGDA